MYVKKWLCIDLTVSGDVVPGAEEAKPDKLPKKFYVQLESLRNSGLTGCLLLEQAGMEVVIKHGYDTLGSSRNCYCPGTGNERDWTWTQAFVLKNSGF